MKDHFDDLLFNNNNVLYMGGLRYSVINWHMDMEFFVHLCMYEQYNTSSFLFIYFIWMYITIWKKRSDATSITLRLWTLCIQCLVF